MEQIWRAPGSGWAAGDGALSVPLRRSEAAWLFGDSLLYDKVTGHLQFVRNSLVRLTSTGPHAVVPGEQASYFRIAGQHELATWLWPSHGIARGDDVWVFLSEEHAGADVPMDWAYGGLWLAHLDRDTLAIRSLVRWSATPGIMWGAWLIARGGYVYIFGVGHRASHRDTLHLARTTSIGRRSTWRYWDGRNWSRSPAASAALVAGVGDQLSVVRVAGGFRLLTVRTAEGHTAVTFHARRLEGSWQGGRTLSLPARRGSGIYGLSAHPELSRSALIVSYSEWVPGAPPREPRFARVSWRCLAAD